VPHFTQVELDELYRSPRQLLQDAFRSGGAESARSCYDAMELPVRDITDLYRRWAALNRGWLIECHGFTQATADAAQLGMPPAGAVPAQSAPRAAIAHHVMSGPETRSPSWSPRQPTPAASKHFWCCGSRSTSPAPRPRRP